MSKYRNYLRNFILAGAAVVMMGSTTRAYAADFKYDFRNEAIMQEMEQHIAETEAWEEETMLQEQENVSINIGNREWETLNMNYIRLESEFENKVYVSMKKDGYVTVYSNMDESSKYTGKLFPGSCVEIIAEEKGWYLVKAVDFQGYVKVDEVLTGIEAANTVIAELQEKAIVLSDTLNIRREPSTECEVLDVAVKGNAYIILKEGSAWCQIKLENGLIGYVSSEFVTVNYDYTDTISAEEEARIAEEARKKAEEEARKKAEEERRRREEEARQEAARREQARLDAVAAAAGLPAGSLKSLGTFRITHYCTCTKCTKGLGITASGTRPVEGRTIAVYPAQIGYGTTVVLNNHAYVAEDCGGGIGANCIDVYVSDHARAIQLGVYWTEVFVRVR